MKFFTLSYKFFFLIAGQVVRATTTGAQEKGKAIKVRIPTVEPALALSLIHFWTPSK
jgi:hypothetical protein